MSSTQVSEERFYTALLDLEQEVRELTELKQLEYLMVNRSRQFLPADIVIFWEQKGTKIKLQRVSNHSEINASNTPFIQEFENSLNHHFENHKEKLSDIHDLALPSFEFKNYFQWTGFQLLWSPLKTFDNDKTKVGLVFIQANNWQKKQILLAERFASIYGYAYQSLQLMTAKKPKYSGFSIKPLWWVAIAAGVLLIPVQQSVIASANVVAKDPKVITAPLSGVIEEIKVTPNQIVKRDDDLFIYETSTLKNEYEVSQRLLQSAQARLAKTQQQAFANAELKSQLVLLKNQIQQRQLEQEYAKQQLQRAIVKSTGAGVVILDDPQALLGKPVQVGEKVLVIANPQQVELEILLAVEDAILMEPGAKVTLFLNSAPTKAITAELTYASYHASPTAEGYLAYRLSAEFTNKDQDGLPRIGQRGSAKIHGESVSLFYYLFRRPLSVLRQTFGF